MAGTTIISGRLKDSYVTTTLTSGNKQNGSKAKGSRSVRSDVGHGYGSDSRRIENVGSKQEGQSGRPRGVGDVAKYGSREGKRVVGGGRALLLPFESLLGTMLHELAHMEVGPHNADFYRLLGELTQVRWDGMIRVCISHGIEHPSSGQLFKWHELPSDRSSEV